MGRIKRRNKVVYVAGPFRAKTDYERVQNIRAAEAVAYKLWVMGFTVICPHMNTANMEGLISDEEILAGDMELLKRSDFVVSILPFGDEKIMKSVGTQNEFRYADSINKPIYDNFNTINERE